MGPAVDEINSETLRFPKLNGENYASWSVNMQAALQAKFLWLYVTGDEIQPPDPGPTPPPEPKSSTTSSTGKPSEAAAASSSPLTLDQWRAMKKEYLAWLRNDQAAMGIMSNAVERNQRSHVAHAKTSKEMWDTWHRMYFKNQSSVNIHYYYEELYRRK
jgi:hypothetical protein